MERLCLSALRGHAGTGEPIGDGWDYQRYFRPSICVDISFERLEVWWKEGRISKGDGSHLYTLVWVGEQSMMLDSSDKKTVV